MTPSLYSHLGHSNNHTDTTLVLAELGTYVKHLSSTHGHCITCITQVLNPQSLRVPHDIHSVTD